MCGNERKMDVFKRSDGCIEVHIDQMFNRPEFAVGLSDGDAKRLRDKLDKAIKTKPPKAAT